MFVKKSKSSSGRTILTYTYGYRENGTVKHKNFETIGYLDELEKQYDDPIAHFKKEAEHRFKDFKPDVQNSISLNPNRLLTETDQRTKKNIGSIFLIKFLDELGLKSILKKKQSTLKIKYSLYDVLQLLVVSRILYPASKTETYESKDQYFDSYSFSHKDMFRALDHFNALKHDIQKAIWKNTKNVYQRDASTAYYDCTNYYFEISYNDEDLIDELGNILDKGYRKNGAAKDKRNHPIVQMGLYMDKAGIPLSYHLFPGNESEKTSLIHSLHKTQIDFGIQKTIVVADRGLNTSDNIFFLAGKNDEQKVKKDGYVYGQSILSADKEFKEWALRQDDFLYDTILDQNGQPITTTEAIFDEEGNVIRTVEKSAVFKHKSRLYAKQITIQRDGKRKQKVTVYQKQMVYYSQKYAVRQKKLRAQALLKAQDLINHPGKYTKATSYGAAGYIKNLAFNKDTGEVVSKALSLDITRITEEERFDGYYSIVTSEQHLSDQEIREIYRGLWKIEESFRITKSELKARPVHVWTKEHIDAHFLTCFIALVLVRLMEVRLSKKYTLGTIVDSLRGFETIYLEQNYYVTPERSEVIRDLEDIFRFQFNKNLIHKNYFKEIRK